MADCIYHPIYRSCRNCGSEMERDERRECVVRTSDPELPKQIEIICEAVKKEGRSEALREARQLIVRINQETTSPSIRDVLTEFDLEFPEAKHV